MANHGYITVKRSITPEQLCSMIKQIVAYRFPGGPLRLSTGGGVIVITAVGDPELEQLCFWMKSPRVIEHRHPRGRAFWWLETVIANDLAVVTNGTLSDSGVDGEWRGEAGKFPTLRSYIDETTSHLRGVKRAFVRKVEMRTAPKCLRRLGE